MMNAQNQIVEGNPEGATNQEAYDEAMRELDVRERCFARWVKEGKMSRSDARARLDRQARCCKLLSGLPDVTVNSEKELAPGALPF